MEHKIDDEKKYYIPPDVVEIGIEIKALSDLFDKYAIFSYKLAKKTIIKKTKYDHCFWKRIYELYPELVGKRLKFDLGADFVTIVEEVK